MNNIVKNIEAILFVSSSPQTIEKLAAELSVDVSLVQEAVDMLMQKYQKASSGIVLIESSEGIEFATNPDSEGYILEYIKKEHSGELTRAQLETLTIIGYRQPITRPEIEQIRGVNSSVILRNLLVRGFIVEMENSDELFPQYGLSATAMEHLGIAHIEELPEYETLASHEYIELTLNAT